MFNDSNACGEESTKAQIYQFKLTAEELKDDSVERAINDVNNIESLLMALQKGTQGFLDVLSKQSDKEEGTDEVESTFVKGITFYNEITSEIVVNLENASNTVHRLKHFINDIHDTKQADVVEPFMEIAESMIQSRDMWRSVKHIWFKFDGLAKEISHQMDQCFLFKNRDDIDSCQQLLDRVTDEMDDTIKTFYAKVDVYNTLLQETLISSV